MRNWSEMQQDLGNQDFGKLELRGPFNPPRQSNWPKNWIGHVRKKLTLPDNTIKGIGENRERW
jgi:hypothetical protein